MVYAYRSYSLSTEREMTTTISSCNKSKILVFGGTGYLGKHVVGASVSFGHPTFVFARSATPQTPPSNLHVRDELRSLGVTLIEVFLSLKILHKCYTLSSIFSLHMTNRKLPIVCNHLSDFLLYMNYGQQICPKKKVPCNYSSNNHELDAATLDLRFKTLKCMKTGRTRGA